MDYPPKIWKALCVFLAVASGGFSSKKRPYFFEVARFQKPTNHESEEVARREMIAIRLINSASTSVSNPNMKKHMAGTSMDICE